MPTLKSILTNSLSYDPSWGIWAEKIDGRFDLEKSEARFGQFAFDNGGMLDDYDLVGDNVSITNARDNYCGTDDDCENCYEEWAERFIEELNTTKV
jgi:hypothetical protein